MTQIPRVSSNPSCIVQAIENARRGQETWQPTSIDDRIGIAKRYREELQKHSDRMIRLIAEETSKLPRDVRGELNASIAKIDLSILALNQRRSDQVVSSTTTQSDAGPVTLHRNLFHAPLGTVLVLGPFNFPLHLPGGQIIPALLAGNTVVFKPSELATRVGIEMVDRWRSAGLPDSALQIIEGGAEVAKQAIDSPLIDGVFFTGSRAAGVSIHRQLAGRPEVLLALEMGGNNPVIVDPSASPEDVAELVSFSAFASSGQRCTCARRVIFIVGEQTDLQLEQLLARSRSVRVGRYETTPDAKMGALVHEQAADRIEQTYETLLSLGCDPVMPFRRDPDDRSIVFPTIVDGRALNHEAIDEVGQLEWFGPLLVILSARDLTGAIEIANRTPYGLSVSMLGGSLEDFQRVGQQVVAGVINFNSPTTGAAGLLPFGGRGHSGNHRAAGFQVIDFCCDPIASLSTASLSSETGSSVRPWESL